jgi:hypothetical protein
VGRGVIQYKEGWIYIAGELVIKVVKKRRREGRRRRRRLYFKPSKALELKTSR